MAESSTRIGRLQRVPTPASQGLGGPEASETQSESHGPSMGCLVCGVSALRPSCPGRFQGFQLLKAAHSALEEEYLKACREQHPAQQLAGSKETPGKFDPGRYVLGREVREDR